MKKIDLWVYTALNLGDDLFIKVLCDRYPNQKFKMKCDKKYSLPFESIKNLEISNLGLVNKIAIRIINKFPFLYKLITKRKSNKIKINIGGSIFMQQNNWKNIAKLREYETYKYDKVLYLGCNFGPFYDSEFLDTYKNVLSKTADICFRDKKSFDYFSNNINTRFASDMIFSLNNSEVEDHPSIYDEYIFVSVINLENRASLKEYTKTYENKIVEVANNLIDNGKKVVLASFCKKEGDEEAINRIYEQISNKNYVNKEFYNGDISKFLNLIKNSSGVITTRFHSLILAWKYNIKVFPISYSNKIDNIISDSSFEGEYVKIENINEVSSDIIINQVLNGENYYPTNEIESSFGHFDILDKIINNEEDNNEQV